MSQLRIYNTLTRTKEAFVPLTPGEVRMYSCGVTVYDHSHIGHARSVMVFDVICRYLAFRGYRVTFVRNYTDVDDKIIRRAQQEGVAASDVSERFIREFRADMEALGVLPTPAAITYHDPKATDFVPGMVALIERLVDRGYAYVVDGDVYFEIARFPPYGRLSGRNLDDLQAGARVDVDERKRDPRDFALWKAAKPGEPAWPSPWGPGRPGWHVECSVMAMRYLGPSFDIHGGGADLIFPHHECEIAQSEADTGQPLARIWAHNGLVNFGAEKMSKSLGNTLLIREVLKRHEPDALRVWLLGTHYRHPVDFSEERLQEAARALERLRGVVEEARRVAPSPPGDGPGRGLEAGDTKAWLAAIDDAELRRQAELCVASFLEAMDDDFNTSGALAALFDLGRELNKYRDAGPLAGARLASFAGGVRVLTRLAEVLGLFQRTSPAPARPAHDQATVEQLVAEREEARKQRNFKRADELRQKIASLGASVEDTPTGPKVKWSGR